MTEWDYHVARLRPSDRTQHQQLAYLQDLGKHGWELVAVAGEWAYFKRRVGCGSACYVGKPCDNLRVESVTEWVIE